MKHKPILLEYDDSSGKYIGCEACGLWMGFAEGPMVELGRRDGPDYMDGECPGEPIENVVVMGWRTFWISPGYGGGIDSSIRRLYGGSGWLSSYDGAEDLSCVERTPGWFSDLASKGSTDGN
jgi:hypothetical protein